MRRRRCDRDSIERRESFGDGPTADAVVTSDDGALVKSGDEAAVGSGGAAAMAVTHQRSAPMRIALPTGAGDSPFICATPDAKDEGRVVSFE